MGMKYYDISPKISERLAVWPGDQPFVRSVALDFKCGDHLTLSSMKGTLHLGAHVDAPSHYHADGESVESRDLDYYMGLCQVVSVSVKSGERVFPEDIEEVSVQAPRVLVKTGSFTDPERWNSDFNSLSPELIHFLAKKGVKLVGIDTPSVDPQDSKKLESHKAVYELDMAILEGVILTEVSDGLYDLVALPLPLEGCDASPVRAILREL